MAVTKATGAGGKGYIVVEEEKCKACELCAHFCPQDNLGLGEAINSRGFHPVRMLADDKCTACAYCALMCPEVCIKVFRR